MRHTISVLVENKFGVLTRIAGMFSGRGFNIDTLNVGPTLDPSTSRMTIVVRGDDTVLEQVTKQLDKLVDGIEIEDFSDDEVVERELVLMRVSVNSETRAEVMQIGDISAPRSSTCRSIIWPSRSPATKARSTNFSCSWASSASPN